MRLVRTALRGMGRDFLRRMVRAQAFGALVASALLSSIASGEPINVGDLNSVGNPSGLVIHGASYRPGANVATGDFNGDGLADVAIGAYDFYDYDAGQAWGFGRVYVIFGRTQPGDFNLSDLIAGTADGFIIEGEAAGDHAGKGLACAGDVNGDGKDDLIVGAPNSDANGGDSGRAYVVFGKTAKTTVLLSSVVSGTGGFAINGPSPMNYSCEAVDGAGDVNGDGLDDVIVGSHDSSPYGAAWVVFGKTSGTAVNLADFAEPSPTGGFLIQSFTDTYKTGRSVAGLGDIDGDGLDDVIVGSDEAENELGAVGRAFVIAGRASTSIVQLSDVAAGTGGFVINGERNLDRAGREVASAGDVNGDGRPDVLIAAMYATTTGMAGKSYVVFGKLDGAPVNLTDVTNGTGGFTMLGEAAQDRAGISLSTAGDLNNDGRDDILVGAPRAPEGGKFPGRAYVVYGKESGTAVSLTDIVSETGGFALEGGESYDYAGQSVSGGGDFNGDGVPDMIISSPLADALYVSTVYVVFGPFDSRKVWADFNNAGTEDGTFDLPYNTLAEAITNVPINGTITIKGTGADDTTGETMVITKPLRIESVGDPIKIGTP